MPWYKAQQRFSVGAHRTIYEKVLGEANRGGFGRGRGQPPPDEVQFCAQYRKPIRAQNCISQEVREKPVKARMGASPRMR